MVYQSPGRVLRRVRGFRAIDLEHARLAAIDRAGRFCRDALVARYAVTWDLYELRQPEGKWTKVATGHLESGSDRGEGVMKWPGSSPRTWPKGPA